MVRNVFDDKSFNWLSGTWRGERFDDPRWRYVRSLQRPRNIYAVVHQEMVTAPRLSA